MRILVTGGTGTISSGIVAECVNRGYDTIATTRGSNKYRNVNGAKYIYLDIFNDREIDEKLKDETFDVVVECLVYSVEQLKVSLGNFASRCKQYVFISTAGIYNRKEDRITEADAKSFSDWEYTKEKIECEEYLIEYSKQRGLTYTIIRPTVTYGNYRIPFPIATRNPGWTFFERLLDGKPMLACENVKFSIIHIDDFSKMVVSLFGNNEAMNEDFHVSSNDNDVFWDDVIIEAGKILNIKPNIIHIDEDVFRIIWPSIYDELRYNKNLSLILDDHKIKKVSGVTARIDLKTGIKRVYENMKEEFLNNECTIDQKWNDLCNSVIYFAFKHDMIKEEEQEMVQEFITTHKKEVISSEIRVKKSRRVEKFHRYMNKLKRICNIAK